MDSGLAKAYDTTGNEFDRTTRGQRKSKCRQLLTANKPALISPETNRVAFLVNAMETTSRRIDDQIQVFRFAFVRVKAEGLVFHVHFGGRQRVTTHDSGYVNVVTVNAIARVDDSADWCPYVGSTQRRYGHRQH
jgi:hypothetical protein